MEKSVRSNFSEIIDSFGLTKADIRTYSPLALAFLGDTVFEQIIRTIIVSKGNVSPKKLHQSTISYVNAKAQAQIMDNIIDELTEEEREIYRRGKNSSPGHKAKSAALSEYLKATGFEAVVGYLYLTDNYTRALELIKKGIEKNDRNE